MEDITTPAHNILVEVRTSSVMKKCSGTLSGGQVNPSGRQVPTSQMKLDSQLVEDRVTGQTPEMEENPSALAQIQTQPVLPDTLALEEEEIEEELIIEDFTIDGICGVY